MKNKLRGLYAITPETGDRADLLSRVDAALSGGCRILQYRDKLSSMPTSLSAPLTAPAAAPTARPSSGFRKISPIRVPQNPPLTAPMPIHQVSAQGQAQRFFRHD